MCLSTLSDLSIFFAEKETGENFHFINALAFYFLILSLSGD
nr:putative protein [uncultured bacterium]